MNLNRYILYFIILSFVGYIYETIAMSIWSGKFENRGFLFGPIIPIYGAGAAFGTILFTYLLPNPSVFRVFIISVVASAILEYPTHYILEKVFHQKWWDYTKAPLNLNGRICLFASIGFGIGGILIFFVINPIVIPLLMKISDSLANGLAIISSILFTWDLATTVAYISDFEERVAHLIDDVVDNHVDNFLDKFLDEDKAFKDRFYGAMDKISDASELGKQKMELAKKIVEKGSDKLGFKTSKLYNSTIKRFVRVKQYRMERYNKNNE